MKDYAGDEIDKEKFKAEWQRLRTEIEANLRKNINLAALARVRTLADMSCPSCKKQNTIWVCGKAFCFNCHKEI